MLFKLAMYFPPRGTILFKTLRSTHAALAREVSLSQEEYDKLEVSFTC